MSKKKRSGFVVLLRILALFVLCMMGIWAFLAKPRWSSYDSSLREAIFSINSLKSEAEKEKPMLRNLKEHLTVMSETYAPRSYAHKKNLNAVADYIKGHFAKTSGRVSEQQFVVSGETYRNIIVEFGPKEGKTLIIGAHYDGAADTPGADDNASGTAGLLELARLLDKKELKKNITLVAYTLEEPPFFGSEDMGSAHHARKMKAEKRDVYLMISLEMIGYYTDKWFTQKYPSGLLYFFYPWKGNFVATIDRLGSPHATNVKQKMNEVIKMSCYSLNAPPEVPGVDYSDHRNYWAEGYDAVMVTDTAFMRNKNYHTLKDTKDTLDYDRMAEVVLGVYYYAHSWGIIEQEKKKKK